jgi:hypothetical protein
MNKLKQRWGLKPIFNSHHLYRFLRLPVGIGMVVKTVLYLLGITKGDLGYWFTPIINFPIYQLLWLLIGFLFGQFKFFWA